MPALAHESVDWTRTIVWRLQSSSIRHQLHDLLVAPARVGHVAQGHYLPQENPERPAMERREDVSRLACAAQTLFCIFHFFLLSVRTRVVTSSRLGLRAWRLEPAFPSETSDIGFKLLGAELSKYCSRRTVDSQLKNLRKAMHLNLAIFQLHLRSQLSFKA